MRCNSTSNVPCYQKNTLLSILKARCVSAASSSEQNPESVQNFKKSILGDLEIKLCVTQSAIGGKGNSCLARIGKPFANRIPNFIGVIHVPLEAVVAKGQYKKRLVALVFVKDSLIRRLHKAGYQCAGYRRRFASGILAKETIAGRGDRGLPPLHLREGRGGGGYRMDGFRWGIKFLIFVLDIPGSLWYSKHR